VVGYSIAIAGCYLAGYLVPGSLNWGFHFLGFLPTWCCVLYFVCISVAILAGMKGIPPGFIRSAANLLHRRPREFLVVLIMLVISCGIVLRIRIPLLGDGFYLVRNYVEAFRGVAPLYPRDEPLATGYFSLILGTTGMQTFQQFLDAFLVADLLLAAGFVINVFMIVRTIYSESSARFVALLFLLVLPYMQLFFGYVEIYSAVLFAVSLHLNISLLCLHRKISFLFVPISLLVAVLTHYLALLLLPSLLLLTFLQWKGHRRKEIVFGYGVALSSLLLLLALINFNVEDYYSWVPYSHFLSIVEPGSGMEKSSEAYTLFSPYHVVDIANLLILLCPAALFLIATSVRSFRKNVLHDSTGKYLLSATLPPGIFLCLVKFDLGAARDWDVFTPYVFILALFAVWMHLGRGDSVELKPITMIILVTAIHTFLYIYFNTTRDQGIRRYQTFFDKRVLPQVGYYNATLFLSQYYHQIKNPDEPVVLWHRYVDAFPGDPRGYLNVINNYDRNDEHAAPEIMETYERWQQNDSGNAMMKEEFATFCLDAGNRYFSQNKFSEAQRYYRKLLSLDTMNPRAYNNLGSVYAQQEKYDEAVTWFRRAISLDSTYSDAYYNLGIAMIDNRVRGDGINLIVRAAQLGNNRARQELQERGIRWRDGLR
ncbi:MAG TPA: tetratricopeptide repeat protein, partial [Bacteroidota bacterium]|nr:tetratricopeptide repeat protein [Bacteroidota bacterium]